MSAAEVDVVLVPVVLRGRVVLRDAVLEDAAVVIEGDRIVWVGAVSTATAPVALADAVAAAPAPVPGTTILPGLVDVHCHGGGGASFPDALDADDARRASREHLRHGTTSLVASLVTADAETLVRQTALLADLADGGELAGIHLEGPFLSRARCGAQNPADMIPGSAELVGRIATAARGHLVSMTLAPEIAGVCGPGGAIEALAAAGAIPSLGHTNASAEQVDVAILEARAALARPGTRSARPTATHLFNGMRALHHRDPGPIAACLGAAGRGDMIVELIADGVHLADGTIRAVFDLVGADSIVLVTDAMAAAGMPDGTYDLGPMRVRVADGVARLADGDAIAGGTGHLLDLVRCTVAAGVPLADAVRSASGTSARVLGRRDIGALEVGRRADVVVVDADLAPLRVMRSGEWIDTSVL
ncbi:N-acetylglucosamine-6-phosphate deacetylase [Pengzhenrongella frigida]|uniref:N-acetylglucosamine-6-phosphate deacetylase n=1 Tax=Pengzhenrongella frigida TaxID=1259133 RepID=A0A4Q5N3R4_9MICO|nr:amidohydrolase family protein [Cellulomonas sp. HLT2-17]RYV50661.1 N-acetylglucosamine-6-phosphate deacetylase [Cellulomonas sp. HLT2-17]